MSDNTSPGDRVGWEHIWYSGDIPPKYRTLSEPNESVIGLADMLPAGGFVLDIGCGVGRHCVYLGGRGFKMAGVDVSPTGIAATQEICAERGISFEGKVADMNAMPWPDATFDGALSTSTIHHALRPSIRHSLDDILRVLKPGGILLVDFQSKSRPDYQELIKLADAGEISQPEPDTFIDNRPDSDDGDAFLPHHFSDEADVRDLLSAFELIRVWPEGNVRGKWVALARRPASL